MRAKNWQLAATHWSAVLEAKPDDNQGLRARGSAYAELGLHDQALLDQKRAVELNPKSANTWNTLCWGRILASDLAQARSACEMAVELNRWEMNANANVGHTYLLSGDFQSAWAWYEKTIPLIDNEDELRDGPLADFDIFISKVWQVEKANEARQYFADKGNDWLIRKAPADALLEEAKAAESQQDHAHAVALRVQHLQLLNSLFPIPHPKIKQSLKRLLENMWHHVDKLEEKGHFREALEVSKPLLIAWEVMNDQDRDNFWVVAVLNQQAGLYESIGEYEKAEPLLVRSLAIREEKFGLESSDTAIGLNNLASLYETQGQYAKAEPLYLRALSSFEKFNGTEHSHTANALSNLANLYVSWGQIAKAEPLYVRALSIQEKALGPNHPDTARTLNNLADLYREQGRYGNAEPMLLRALNVVQNYFGSDAPQVAPYLNNVAVLYSNLGRPEKSEPLYQRALSIREAAFGAEHPETANSLNNLATLYVDTKQYIKAEPLLVRVVQIFEKSLGPDHPKTGTAINNLAVLHGQLGQNKKQEAGFVRALAISEKEMEGDNHELANRLNNLAVFYFDHGKLDQAQPLFNRAYRIALKGSVPKIKWTVQNNLSRFHAKTTPSLAIFYGKQAINTLQGVRGNLKASDKDTQKSFLDSVEIVYQHLADLLIAQGRLPEAQQVLAMLKEDEYYDFIRRDASADSRSTRASFTGQEAPWDEKLQAAGGRLTALGAEAQTLRKKKEQGAELTGAETRRLAELEPELEAAGAAFVQTLEALQAAFADVSDKQRYAELEKKGVDNDLTEVIGSFGPDVALLQYVVMPEGTHILLTTGATRIARKANVAQAELNQAVNALVAVLKTPTQDHRPAAQKLYGYLIAPVAEDLQAMQAKTLMLSLDGVLRYIPMAALYDGEQYLAQRYALALYTDAARESLKDKPRGQWKMAGLGLTQAREGFDPLPGVQGEMDSLVKTRSSQGVLPGVVKLDEQFNPLSFKETLRERYPVVHIASHFKFDPAGEAESFLLMGDGSRLSLNAIRKQGYSFAGVDLMTLSACQTGVGGGKDANGREIEGFGVLAQKQGAKGVIATLWPVADESTALFMREFYRLRETRKLSKAQALRQAQLALLSGAVARSESITSRGERKVIQADNAFVSNPQAPFAHPYYWAPFILMGNWL